jgi:hypothetical protein
MTKSNNRIEILHQEKEHKKNKKDLVQVDKFLHER